MNISNKSHDFVRELSECPMSKMVLAMNGGVCGVGPKQKEELDQIREMSKQEN